VGPAALPDRPSQADALGPSWLFLQRNNSQTHNCRYKYEDLCGLVIPMLGILGKAPGRSFQSQYCHLFHLFYQEHIRLGPQV
jgi:hypothetical protein